MSISRRAVGQPIRSSADAKVLHEGEMIVPGDGHCGISRFLRDISINKAFTARAFDISTAELSEQSQPGRQFYGIGPVKLETRPQRVGREPEYPRAIRSKDGTCRSTHGVWPAALSPPVRRCADQRVPR
jgi:hypothetical protein